MWIKICGNTSLADAQCAVTNGANAVGFVFASSPRRVTPDQVAAITPRLPRNVERIGVFVNAGFDEIVSTVEIGGLTGVQLHVSDDPELPRRLRAHFSGGGPEPFRILSVLAFSEDLEPAMQAIAGEATVDALLIDSRTATAHGGTGRRYDWQAARPLFRQFSQQLRLVAAGGLNPENVAEAIQTLRPWGVDVASGVEATPGHKDPERVAAFLQHAREAFAEAAGQSRA